MGEISEDLQNFLTECEVLYADRYTDKDLEYIKYCEDKFRQIPIEERWFTRPPRQYDRNDNGGHRDRWENRGYSRDNRDNRGYNRDRDNRDYRGERDNRGWRQRDRYGHRNNPYERNPRQYDRH